MSIRERRARDIQDRIRQVLLHEWDPIGVADVPEAQDEYDAYIGGVYRLLAQGADAPTVAAHLARVEADRMGLPSSSAARLTVATMLCALDIHLDPPNGAA